MNKLRNIPILIKALWALKHLNKEKKAIEKARSNQDYITERKHIKTAMNTWGNEFLKLAKSTYEVIDKENLPSEGPVVYMCNHQSYFDIIVLCAALDTTQFGYIAKSELLKLPLYGKWIRRVRSVSIDRGNPRESLKAITKGIKYIKDGFSLLIFPEGTRSKCSEIGEFKKGSIKLATKPGVPIVPISLEGTYKLFEKNGYFTPGHIKIKIHEPIPTKGLSREEEKELNNEVYNIIYKGHEELMK